ncbi:MAG: hypothetical protein O2888_03590 [Chloroflexi bacterium]|nr:hypothetical protein [Chloroflexota bacterium]
MLRLLLVAAPEPGQWASVGPALAPFEPSALYVSPSMAVAAGDAAGRMAAHLGLTKAPDARLDADAPAVAFVQELPTGGADADGTEPVVVVVASLATVRAIVIHALAAPIAPERLQIAPGTIAEVEVRADAPWTVNRLSDGCHLDDSRI